MCKAKAGHHIVRLGFQATDPIRVCLETVFIYSLKQIKRPFSFYNFFQGFVKIPIRCYSFFFAMCFVWLVLHGNLAHKKLCRD